MAYTPTTWKRGDVITASKLNNIESSLKAWDEKGYDSEVQEVVLYQEAITTTNEYTFSITVDGNTHTVEFAPPANICTLEVPVIHSRKVNVKINDIEYTPTIDLYSNFLYYGAPYDVDSSGAVGEEVPTITADFTDYPFCLLRMPDGHWVLLTETAGTYSVSIVERKIKTEVSDAFKNSVSAAMYDLIIATSEDSSSHPSVKVVEAYGCSLETLLNKLQHFQPVNIVNVYIENGVEIYQSNAVEIYTPYPTSAMGIGFTTGTTNRTDYTILEDGTAKLGSKDYTWAYDPETMKYTFTKVEEESGGGGNVSV